MVLILVYTERLEAWKSLSFSIQVERFQKLVQLTNTLDSSARLCIHDRQLCELLRHCSILLDGISTSAITRSRLHLFLFNLGWVFSLLIFNLKISRFFVLLFDEDWRGLQHQDLFHTWLRAF